MKTLWNILALSGTLLFAPLAPVRAALPDEVTDVDRTGRLGIGPTFSNWGSGPGLRYWITDRVGVDAGAYFDLESGRSGSDYDVWGGMGGLVLTIKKKGGLRFEGLLGVSYDREKSVGENPGVRSEIHRKTVTVAGGVGAEYSFRELPDLSLSAFFSGVGIEFSEEDRESIILDATSSSHDTYRSFNTSPQIGLSARYYF